MFNLGLKTEKSTHLVCFGLYINTLSPRSQSSRTWSFYKPACFLSEKRSDSEGMLTPLEWNVK